jgi:hypothetical protein
MSVWFFKSRRTVASVSGDPDVRLMIASRVQVMWSSHSCLSVSEELVSRRAPSLLPDGVPGVGARAQKRLAHAVGKNRRARDTN